MNKPLVLERYDNLLDDIKKYNRADTVNMTENEMNKFRHIAGTAFMTSNYYPSAFIRLLGVGKEIKDLFQGRGFKDTFFDLGNNEKGLSIGNKFKGNSRNGLFDHIFKTEIEPYRIPTLYGKIIND